MSASSASSASPPPGRRAPRPQSLEAVLRRRLLAAFVTLFAIGGVAAYLWARELFYRSFDDELRARARTVAALAELDEGRVEFTVPAEPRDDAGSGGRREHFELWESAGGSIARSRSLGEGHLQRPEAAWGSGECRAILLPDGRPGRATVLRFLPEPDPDQRPGGEVHLRRGGGVRQPASRPPTPDGAPPPRLELCVAKATDAVRASLARFVGGFALGISALLGLSLVVIRRAARASLRPVGELARAVSTIGARSLEQRLPSARTAELQPIVDTLNDLLGRLASAFERERRFTSAAAHELKNPIAELRTLAELAERWPADPEVASATFTELVDLARQMERTVSSLLQIARAESGLPLASAACPTPVGDLVARVWRRFEARAEERDLELVRDLAGGRIVHTDPVLLERIVENLFDNAVEYTPRGGRIRVWDEVDADLPDADLPNRRGFHLAIANTTDGQLDAEALTHLFEPFWRAHPSHEDGGGHAGLGLPLVQALCEALGGRVGAQLDGQELRLRVELPAAAPGPQGAATRGLAEGLAGAPGQSSQLSPSSSSSSTSSITAASRSSPSETRPIPGA